MPRPPLELLIARRPSQLFVDLVQAMRRWSRPVSPDPANPTPAARLASCLDAAMVRDAGRDPVVPLAVWVGDATEAERHAGVIARARVALGPAAEVGHREGVIAVPDTWIDASRWRPASPFVRRRSRQMHQLPSTFTVEVGTAATASGRNLDDDVLAGALGLASAVVGDGPQIVQALAAGAAVVTDEATATWLGADDGTHVLVRSPGAASAAAAEELARDDELAARLGYEGRRLVEDRHDIAATAHRLAVALGLPSWSPSPVLRIRSLLADLNTPTGSPVSLRTATLVASTCPHLRDDVEEWSW